MSSSQGASSTGSVNHNGFLANPAGTKVPVGYKFSTLDVRDGSDWIALKKQTLILNENKQKNFKDPWFVHGNDYRVQFLQGQYKNGTTPDCTKCNGGGFNGSVPFNS